MSYDKMLQLLHATHGERVRQLALIRLERMQARKQSKRKGQS